MENIKQILATLKKGWSVFTHAVNWLSENEDKISKNFLTILVAGLIIAITGALGSCAGMYNAYHRLDVVEVKVNDTLESVGRQETKCLDNAMENERFQAEIKEQFEVFKSENRQQISDGFNQILGTLQLIVPKQ